MAKVVPVLDPKGFVEDINIKADQALSNFYLSQRSQSDFYRGRIVSLADLIRRYGSEPVDLRENTRNLLEGYLRRQFDSVEIKVETIVTGSSIDLRIDAIIRDGNNTINLVHAVKSTNSIIQSIIDCQNNGKEIIPADAFS